MQDMRENSEQLCTCSRVRVSCFRSHADNSLMDMASIWSDRISFFPSHVDPFSLIDITFPLTARKPFPCPIIQVRILRFLCFHDHSYRPFDRSLGMSNLAVPFLCRFFSLGSGIDMAFLYCPCLIVISIDLFMFVPYSFDFLSITYNIIHCGFSAVVLRCHRLLMIIPRSDGTDPNRRDRYSNKAFLWLIGSNLTFPF